MVTVNSVKETILKMSDNDLLTFLMYFNISRYAECLEIFNKYRPVRACCDGQEIINILKTLDFGNQA